MSAFGSLSEKWKLSGANEEQRQGVPGLFKRATWKSTAKAISDSAFCECETEVNSAPTIRQFMGSQPAKVTFKPSLLRKANPLRWLQFSTEMSFAVLYAVPAAFLTTLNKLLPHGPFKFFRRIHTVMAQMLSELSKDIINSFATDIEEMLRGAWFCVKKIGEFFVAVGSFVKNAAKVMVHGIAFCASKVGNFLFAVGSFFKNQVLGSSVESKKGNAEPVLGDPRASSNFSINADSQSKMNWKQASWPIVRGLLGQQLSDITKTALLYSSKNVKVLEEKSSSPLNNDSNGSLSKMSVLNDSGKQMSSESSYSSDEPLPEIYQWPFNKTTRKKVTFNETLTVREFEVNRVSEVNVIKKPGFFSWRG